MKIKRKTTRLIFPVGAAAAITQCMATVAAAFGAMLTMLNCCWQRHSLRRSMIIRL